MSTLREDSKREYLIKCEHTYQWTTVIEAESVEEALRLVHEEEMHPGADLVDWHYSVKEAK